MRNWLDFLFQCLDVLNRNSPLVIALIALWKLVSEGRKAKRESLVERQNITVGTRIAVAVEAIANRASQPKESLTAIEAPPSISKTLFSSPLPQALPPRATPGGLPLERFLPPRATPGGV